MKGGNNLKNSLRREGGNAKSGIWGPNNGRQREGLSAGFLELGIVMISSHIRFFAYLVCLPKPYISMLPKCIR